MAASSSEDSNVMLWVKPKRGHTEVYEFKPLPFTGDYYEMTIANKVASGTYGTVYLGSSKEFKKGIQVGEAKQVAIKMIDTREFDREMSASLRNEISILRRISKKDICQQYLLCVDYIGYGDGILDGFVYIVSEYIDGSELYDIMQTPSFNEENAIRAICNLLNAVSILHNMDIAHRDIKLENIMYNKSTNTYKLIDYGFACLEDDCTGRVGTPYSGAPEIFADRTINDYKKTDIWATGIILFALTVIIYGKLEYFLKYRQFVADVQNGEKDRNHLEGELIKHLTNLKNIVGSEFVNKIVPIITNMVKTKPSERWSINKIVTEVRDMCSGS